MFGFRRRRMKNSTDQILTTHVGRLERPENITRAMEADAKGRPSDAKFVEQLRHAVGDVVRRQAAIGINIVTDGEFGKLSWIAYQHSRLGGYEKKPVPAEGRFSPRGRDRTEF